MNKIALIAGIAVLGLTHAQAFVAYDSITGQTYGYFDNMVKDLADDLHLAGSVSEIKSATVLFYNAAAYDEDVTLNIYAMVGSGDSWTKGALLGSAVNRITDGGSGFVTSTFDLNLPVSSNDIVAEVSLPAAAPGFGVAVGQNPTIGASANRICEDGSYINFLDAYGVDIPSNMGISIEAVPEPATLMALGLGLSALSAKRRKSR